jgi:hypothetical protein
MGFQNRSFPLPLSFIRLLASTLCPNPDNFLVRDMLLGDQASIVRGAIEFVKELERQLQCLEAQKRTLLVAWFISTKLPFPTQGRRTTPRRQQLQPPPPVWSPR